MPDNKHRCPVLACQSERVEVCGPESELSVSMASYWECAATYHGRCRECGAIWELPSDASGPCDNCAYKGTSRETMCPSERARIIDIAQSLTGDAEADAWAPRFACHKGIPIKAADGRHYFDFDAAGIDPMWEHTCAGYLRVRQAAIKGVSNRDPH